MTKGLQLQISVPPSEGNFEGYETCASTESASFYNMDIIPKMQIFFHPENFPVAAKSKTVKYNVKSTGIYSFDPKLDQNANELWRFLLSNLQSPYLFVRIEGTHNIVTNAMDTLHASVVTDFSMQIDVSKFVNPRWSRLVTCPLKKDVAAPTVREIMEGYARCRSTSKKFSLKKMVEWNFDELTELLADHVRSAGYHSKVTITYLVPDYKVVVAHSESAPEMGLLSWLMSELVWPARASASKPFKNRLVCEYSMGTSADDFFDREADRIYDAVRRRRKEEYMVALEPEIKCECQCNEDTERIHNWQTIVHMPTKSMLLI